MIAVSDAVLVLVSATALVAGLYRWQNNLEYVPERAQTTLSGSAANASTNNPNNTDAISASQRSSNITTDINQGTAQQNNQITTELGTQPDDESARVVDVQSEQTSSIDVGQDNNTSSANQASGDATTFATYTIVPGDSLGRLAARFGTSVSVLQEINGIQGSLIQVGQQIRYPVRPIE